ncbi:MAG: hypothetical protein QG610_558, partial [Euryarchaeota archaeon]|nr:hypothetical protein [Euryarchaeota archaeon]
NAELELTHVLVLYDDPNFSILPRNTSGPAYEENKVYDFDLMEDGGHIKGFKINDEKMLVEISNNIESLGTLLAGDGNHSLAAAKSFWENIKGTVPDNHPARYTLVELVNIHDPGLTFEPIHRLVRGIDPEELLKRFNARIVESSSCNSTAEYVDNAAIGHSIEFVTKERRGILIFDKPEHDLEVETLDKIIDDYVVEYEHDPEVVKKLGKEPQSIGFFLPSLKRNEFFALIKKKGILPRKSFSLGKENEKRYYTEARRITQ